MIKASRELEHTFENGTLTIKVRGEMDHHNAVIIRKNADELIYRYRPKITCLDLSSIEFMDSSGLGFLMGRHALMQKLGGKAVLLSPNEKVMRIVKLAGLERIIKIEK